MEDETTDPWGPNTVQMTPDPNREFLSYTIKAGPGYEAPWLVFKFSSIEEMFETLTDGNELGGSFQELEDLAVHVAKRVQSKYSPAKAAPAAAAKPSGNSSGYNRKPQASSAPGDVPTGTCPVHNCDLVYAEGFQKRDGGKVNARVGCPVPKCYAKTIWQNDDGSWKE